MQINVNTDEHITNSKEFTSELSQELERKLNKFKSHITTIEVHLADENGAKGGSQDKRCTIEARIEGLNPSAVTHHASSVDEAFREASRKIERVLRRTIEKRKEY